MQKLLLPRRKMAAWQRRWLPMGSQSSWVSSSSSVSSSSFSSTASTGDSDAQKPSLHVGIVGLGAIGTIFFTKFAHLALSSLGNHGLMLPSNRKLSLQVDALVRNSQLKRFRQHRDVALYTKATKNQFGENEELLRIAFPSPQLHDVKAKVQAQVHANVKTQDTAELRHHNVVINTLENMSATSTAESCDPLDIVIVTVKTYDTTHVLEQLQTKSHLIKPNACVILLQNGLGEFPFESPRSADVCFRSWQLFTGVTLLGGKVMSLGHTLVSGLDAKTFFAPVCGPNNAETSKKMTLFGEVLTASGLNWEFLSPEQMQSIRWGKLIVNAAINPLTSIFDASNHTVADSPFARKCVEAIVSEAYDVAVNEGIQLDTTKEALVEQTIQVADSTGPNTSSLLADLRLGFTQTEIDAINGKIVEVGKRTNTPTPVNEFLLNIIKTMEEQKLRQS